ncbi:26S protease regulatory subunit 6a [Culex quinquefasciatus]|uniref:26S protease regulatory subunit 6a n=1 Tax=Culex quinquefasciatus TaxID=7176 RepID=B0XGF2_CULQU|nr:26S protease regulatory subunit 6a [Culex quinquefasciatus]|eukprot:XP_001868724.1 26S protease regulatory subunit 6a [Culex quinquefasciatus]
MTSTSWHGGTNHWSTVRIGRFSKLTPFRWPNLRRPSTSAAIHSGSSSMTLWRTPRYRRPLARVGLRASRYTCALPTEPRSFDAVSHASWPLPNDTRVTVPVNPAGDSASHVDRRSATPPVRNLDRTHRSPRGKPPIQHCRAAESIPCGTAKNLSPLHVPREHDLNHHTWWHYVLASNLASPNSHRSEHQHTHASPEGRCPKIYKQLTSGDQTAAAEIVDSSLQKDDRQPPSKNKTYFLLVIGLFVPEKLKLGDESEQGLYDARVKVMELDERFIEHYSDFGGLDMQIQELIEAVVLPISHKDMFKNLGIHPPKGVLHAFSWYLCGANKVDLPEAGRPAAGADVHRR